MNQDYPTTTAAAGVRKKRDTLRNLGTQHPIDDWGQEVTHEDCHQGCSHEKRTSSPKQVAKIGRNDPCSCGSGKKYKKCCLN